jgi:hypothetical protein
MRSRGATLAAIAAALSLAIAGSAQGAVTIGSNLAGAPNHNDPGCGVAGVTCTATNLVLPTTSLAPGGLVSPVNGTVTSWRAKANGTDGLSFRVLRPVSGTTYMGAGTSAVFTPSLMDTGVVQTSLPIKVGDAIGLNNVNARLVYDATAGATAAAWYLLPGGPLADGQTRAADATQTPRELLVQATIEPTNSFTFGTAALNKKKGTATLPVTLPNAGTLSYSGTGATVSGPPSVAAAGDISLSIAATGKKRKKLKKKGKAGVSVSVTFTPTFGTAATQSANLTLRKKLKKKK